MKQHVHDVLIVGGGISGMAAAWTARHRDFRLLEASDRLGGRLLSHPRDPYWLNLGGHLFPGAGSVVGSLVDDLGLRTIPIPGSKFGLVWDGQIRSQRRVELYPLTLPMSMRERMAFSLTGIRILRAVAAWRKAQTPEGTAAMPAKDGRPAGFRSVIGRPPRRVAEVFEAAGRRSSTEIDNQSAETAGQLFAAVWAGKKSSLAFNLFGGSGRLADEITEQLRDRIDLGCTVESVEADGDEYVVSVTRAGVAETLRSHAVILATPARVSAHLSSSLPAEVRTCLAEVAYGAFVSLAALTDETERTAWEDMYAVTTPGCAFDMIFNHANPIRDSSGATGGGSVMVYAGGDRAMSMLSWPEDRIVDTMLPDIVRILPHLDGHVVETVVQKWPDGLSYRRPGSDLGPLHRYVAQGSSLQLSGDYFGDLGNMEIAAASGVEAARRVLTGLTA